MRFTFNPAAAIIDAVGGTRSGRLLDDVPVLRPAGPETPQYFGEGTYGTYTFAVKYDSDNQCYNYKFGGALVKYLCGLGWTPNRSEVLAEVHAQQDYVVGTPSNPA